MKPNTLEANGATRVNARRLMMDHAKHNVDAIKRELSTLAKKEQELRQELENWIKHASIEGVVLDDEPILTLTKEPPDVQA